MGIFSRSFDKPGKGIDPNEPQKRSFFRFMDILGRKFWHFSKVNMLYAVALIPTFVIVFLFLSGMISNTILSKMDLMGIVSQTVEGAENVQQQFNQFTVIIDLFVRFIVTILFTVFWGMGPATAGITYIMRNFAREEHAWLWSDFRDSVKSNFKQSLIVFAIDVVVFILQYVALVFYAQQTGVLGALRYVILIMGFIYTMMHLYIYPLMVTFKLSIKDIYRNSLLFALGKLPSNVLVLIIQALIHLGSIFAAIVYGGQYAILLIIIILLLDVFILLSVSSLLVNFNAYPKMKEYMMPKDEGKKIESIDEMEDVFEPSDGMVADGFTDYRKFVKEEDND